MLLSVCSIGYNQAMTETLSNTINWQTWFTLTVIILMVFTLVKEWLTPDVALPTALATLLGANVVTPFDALSGFSNHGLLAIAALFIVAQAVSETGGMNNIAQTLLGKRSGHIKMYARMVLPITAISAFLNNTPVVVMFISPIRSFAAKNNISPSKLLIPLSYASILGGMTTLIGTSTNLVVSGMMEDAGSAPMGMFEISKIGIPAAVTGVLFLIFFISRILPARKDSADQLEGEARQYLIDMIISSDCPLIGKTIEEGGLRGLRGLYLVHIVRQGKEIGLAGPKQVLQSGDRLQFTGLVSTIVELNAIKGLVPSERVDFENPQHSSSNDLRLFEVVVAQGSPLVGQGIRQAGFRNTYNAVVIAVHRAGVRINSKIGDIILKPGDTLMLEAPKSFAKRWYNSTHFYLVSKVADIKPVKHEKFRFVAIVIGIMILLPSLGIIPMVVSAFGAAVILVLSRVISSGSAKKSINLSVLIVIASALGIGRAVENTGLATIGASALIDAVSFLGPVAVLAALMVLTNLFAELVTNQASAAMFFPVAMSAAHQLSFTIDSPQMRAFQMCVAIAAAASFATPLGYQTNLIVYGPGGYKYSDFFKVGSIMNALIITTGLAAAWFWFF